MVHPTPKIFSKHRIRQIIFARDSTRACGKSLTRENKKKSGEQP